MRDAGPPSKFLYTVHQRCCFCLRDMLYLEVPIKNRSIIPMIPDKGNLLKLYSEERCSAVLNHPYFQKKGLKFVPGGITVEPPKHFYANHLAVPIMRLQCNARISTQWIAPPDAEGKSAKFFKAGASLKCGYFPVGSMCNPLEQFCTLPSFSSADWQAPSTIYVAEGLATAITVHEATGYPCLVGFSLGGASRLIETIVSYWPNLRDKLIWASDRDKPGNNHVSSFVLKMAKTYGVRLVFPAEGPCITDFNDVAQTYGLEIARDQLQKLEIARDQLQNTQQSSGIAMDNKDLGDLPVCGADNECLRDMILIGNRYYRSKNTGTRFPLGGKPSKEFAYFQHNPQSTALNDVYQPKDPPGRIRTDKGAYVFNTYIPPEHGDGYPHKGNQLLLKAMRTTYAEDAEILWDYAAFYVQKPGTTVACHPILASRTQGTGKSRFCNLIGKLVGEQNFHMIAAEDLEERFKKQIAYSSTVIVVDEYDATRPLSPAVKGLLSAETGEYERKGIDSVNGTRTANFLLTTNDVDSLWRARKERRLRPILWEESRGTIEEDEMLADLMQDPEAINWLRTWLMNREITNNLNRKETLSSSQAHFNEMCDDPVRGFLLDCPLMQDEFVTVNDLLDSACQLGHFRHSEAAESSKWRYRMPIALKELGWINKRRAVVGSRKERGFARPKLMPMQTSEQPASLEELLDDMIESQDDFQTQILETRVEMRMEESKLLPKLQPIPISTLRTLQGAIALETGARPNAVTLIIKNILSEYGYAKDEKSDYYIYIKTPNTEHEI